jgi:hypothetical protein
VLLGTDRAAPDPTSVVPCSINISVFSMAMLIVLSSNALLVVILGALKQLDESSRTTLLGNVNSRSRKHNAKSL